MSTDSTPNESPPPESASTEPGRRSSRSGRSWGYSSTSSRSSRFSGSSPPGSSTRYRNTNSAGANAERSTGSCWSADRSSAVFVLVFGLDALRVRRASGVIETVVFVPVFALAPSRSSSDSSISSSGSSRWQSHLRRRVALPVRARIRVIDGVSRSRIAQPRYAVASPSTRTSSGNRETSTQTRAGGSSPNRLP